MRRLISFNRLKNSSVGKLKGADVAKLHQLSKYAVHQSDFSEGRRQFLFNINSELFNPVFAREFWRLCRKPSINVGGDYWHSLRLEFAEYFVENSLVNYRCLVSKRGVFQPPDSYLRIAMHLMSTWRLVYIEESLRIAGGLFVSDLSATAKLRITKKKKYGLIRLTLKRLLHSNLKNGFDVIVVGFPAPKRWRQFSKFPENDKSIRIPLSKVTSSLSGDLAILQLNRELLQLSKVSLTTKALISKPLSASVFLVNVVIQQCRHDSTIPPNFVQSFAVFCLVNQKHQKQILKDFGFWERALIPLLADWQRLRLLKLLPGQKNRLDERRKIASLAVKTIYGEPLWPQI